MDTKRNIAALLASNHAAFFICASRREVSIIRCDKSDLIYCFQLATIYKVMMNAFISHSIHVPISIANTIIRRRLPLPSDAGRDTYKRTYARTHARVRVSACAQTHTETHCTHRPHTHVCTPVYMHVLHHTIQIQACVKSVWRTLRHTQYHTQSTSYPIPHTKTMH